MDLRNKIFVIQSTTGAMIMSILAQNKKIDICIIEVYEHLTENLLPVIKKVISHCKIDNLYVLKIPLIFTEKNSRLEFYKEYLWVKNKISVFRDECRQDIFSSEYIYISEWCTLVNFLPYIPKEIYGMDHAPTDAMERLSYQKKHLEKKNFKWLIKWGIKRMIGFPPPMWLYLRQKGRKGFTLNRIKEDTYTLLDYRQYYNPIFEDMFIDDIWTLNEPKVLLALNVKEGYNVNPTVWASFKDIDVEELNVKLVLNHITKKELILVKFHPSLYQMYTKQDAVQYESRFIDKLKSMGYRAEMFKSLLKDSDNQNLPIELFIKRLNIRKIVCFFSSVLEIVSSWDQNVECISDIRGLPVPVIQGCVKEAKYYWNREIKFYTDDTKLEGDKNNGSKNTV